MFLDIRFRHFISKQWWFFFVLTHKTPTEPSIRDVRFFRFSLISDFFRVHTSENYL